MSRPTGFTVNAGWRVLLRDIGIRPVDVLRRAGLPDDLLAQETTTLSVAEYFALWRGLEAEADDPLLPLRLAQAIPVEAFDPPIFAALCSPNLNVAMARLGRFKLLIGPLTLTVDQGLAETTVSMGGLDGGVPAPAALIAVELVFLVRLARLGTRENIRPLRVVSVPELAPASAYADFFGVMPAPGTRNSLVFSAEDARLPFLTENQKMWNFFEPGLRQQRSEMDPAATTAGRVRGALLELLPSGQGSIEDVSRKLAVGKRTLQRRLHNEATSFQSALNQTREELARHYLANSDLSGAEISFLLGYEDPNSFFRAFHAWTGATPETLRGRA